MILAVVAGFALMIVADKLLELRPPDRVSIAAGRQDGAYFAIAERYKEVLAQDGIIVEVIETAGSQENAARLGAANDPADVALVQGGVPLLEGEPRVVALAAVFLEPLLVFHKGALNAAAHPTQWKGLRAAVGEPGSGTRYLIDKFSGELGFGPQSPALLGIGGTAAADALLSGEVDIAVFVAPIGAPYLARLYSDPSVSMASLRHGEGLARRHDFVQWTSLPAGAIDYANMRPPRRIELVAMVARLVTREDLHPALVNRLISAAETIHRGGDLVSDAGAFPSVHGVGLPLDPQAERLLQSGPSNLQSVLPYWIAAQLNRFLILLLPVLFLTLPIIRSLPNLYRWRMRRQIYRFYRYLREIEREIRRSRVPEELARLAGELEGIDKEVRRLSLPAAYKPDVYALRLHIDLMQRLIVQRRDERPAPREL
jgi:TRAP-type uncharacterized transport system substrate-binding protein